MKKKSHTGKASASYFAKHAISLIGEFEGYQLNVESRKWNDKMLCFAFPQAQYIKERNLKYNEAASTILDMEVYGICTIGTFSNDTEFAKYRSYVNGKVASNRGSVHVLKKSRPRLKARKKSLD
jgi:hypothetical protein